jgi:hypothetical protein
MPDVMADRRGAARFPLILVAEITHLSEATVLNARSSDVSRSGCYIDTLNPLPPGTLVLVRLRLLDEVFQANARVVYVCPGLGMGVTFDPNVPADQLAMLDRWVAGATRGQV